MRHKHLTFVLILASISLLHGQQPPLSDFPLTVTIDKGGDYTLKLSASEEIENAKMGIAPPGLFMFWGAINGEHHWVFVCRKEVSGRESVPCTLIPAGEYRGRWVHDSSVLQIVGDTAGSPMTRFLMVTSDTNNPAPKDDPVMRLPAYDFNIPLPKGRSLDSFPFLIHVYGSQSMELPTGTLPGRITCNESTWNPIQTTVNCTSMPPVEIHRGFVDVDFSSGKRGSVSMHCAAKWRWSSCSALEPGFYYARQDKDRLMVLVHESDGKPKEIGFEVNMPADPATASPIK